MKQRTVIARSSVIGIVAVLAIWMLGTAMQSAHDGGPIGPLPARAGGFVVLPSPTLPSSAPPSRTPTRKPTDEPTSTPTPPAVATRPPPGLPLQGDIFSPTPTSPQFVARPTNTPTPPLAAPVPFATVGVGQVPTGDLKPMRIEVFQAVHASLYPGGPEVPLIAKKESLVRVWVLMLGAQPANVSWHTRVELRAFRDGQELTGCGPATADVEKDVVEDVTLQDYENVMSGNLSRTFNFHLPFNCSWIDSGNVELRAKVYGPECTACLENNTIEAQFRFFPMRPLKVRFHTLNYQGQTAEFSYAGLVPWLSAWPISDIDIKPAPADIDVPNTIDLSGEPSETNVDDPWWSAYIDLLAYLQDCCTSTDVDLDIGVLPQSLVTCRGVGGGGWLVTGIGCGGSYMHEGGHGFGLPHSSDAHGECNGGSCDPNWPWLHGRIDGYGWYVLQPDKLILPTMAGGHSHDTMSYGKCAEDAPGYNDSNSAYCGKWLSTLNYARIGQRLWCFDPQWDVEKHWLFGVSLDAAACYSLPWPQGGPFAQLLINPMNDLIGSSAGSSPGASGEVHAASLAAPSTGYEHGKLQISGVIGAGGAVDLRPLYHVPAEGSSASPEQSTAPPPTGSYRVELWDAERNLLVSGSFEPTPLYGHAAIRRATFEGIVPWDPATERIVLRRGDAIVAERLVSPSAPRVRLLSPVGGEQFGSSGALQLSWDGEDPDGDALWYSVQYSADGGRTWMTVRRNLQTTLAMDLGRLPASTQARVRILATDGVRTAVAESDLFAVAGGASVPGPLPR